MLSTTPLEEPEDPWLPLPAEAWEESPTQDGRNPVRTPPDDTSTGG